MLIIAHKIDPAGARIRRKATKHATSFSFHDPRFQFKLFNYLLAVAQKLHIGTGIVLVNFF